MKPTASTASYETLVFDRPFGKLLHLDHPAVVENPTLKDLLWLNSIISSGTGENKKISSGAAPSFPTWPKWCLSLYEFPQNPTKPEGKTPSIHTSAQRPIPTHPPTHPNQPLHSHRDPFETKPSPKVTIGHHVGPSKVAAEGPSLHHLQHLHVSGVSGEGQGW